MVLCVVYRLLKTLAVRQQNSQVILIAGTEARFVDTIGGLTSEIKSWWGKLMDADFWHSKWTKNEIGFHLAGNECASQGWFSSFKLAPGSRVFVPLCGKSVDMWWLSEQGMQVVGVAF